MPNRIGPVLRDDTDARQAVLFWSILAALGAVLSLAVWFRLAAA